MIRRTDPMINLFVHEYGHYVQGQYLGAFYVPIVAMPSLASEMGIGGENHDTRWFEVNASYLGSRHFNHKYGINSEYAKEKLDYFDIEAFQYGGKTVYMNPRNGGYNVRKQSRPIHNPRHSGWDYIIPFL